MFEQQKSDFHDHQYIQKGSASCNFLPKLSEILSSALNLPCDKPVASGCPFIVPRILLPKSSATSVTLLSSYPCYSKSRFFMTHYSIYREMGSGARFDLSKTHFFFRSLKHRKSAFYQLFFATLPLYHKANEAYGLCFLHFLRVLKCPSCFITV